MTYSLTSCTTSSGSGIGEENVNLVGNNGSRMRIKIWMNPMIVLGIGMKKGKLSEVCV